MILGIDAGNTNLVAALMDKDGLHSVHRFDTLKQESALYYTKHLKRFSACSSDIEGIIISSVVPEINGLLDEACKRIFDLSPMFVSAALKTGLVVQYDNPEKLGADLICDAVGAVSKYGAPAIVIDMGTATTISVVNEKMQYLGSVISPGPLTSIKTLASSASQLPEVEFEIVDKAVGTNTADCIKIGVFNAHCFMLDSMIDHIKNRLALQSVQVVATGGLSEVISKKCSHAIVYDRDLIFDGLYKLYKLNQTAK